MGTPSERWFERLVALVAFTTLLQGLLAGIFIAGHGATAALSLVLALITVVLATLRLRPTRPGLWRGANVLFGLELSQTVIGLLMANDHDRWLIALHIPLAVALFGVALGLTLRADAQPVRRGCAG